MFGTYQKKLLTVFYSGGSNPLEKWDIQVKNGWTRRIKDEDLGNIVFEVAGTNVATAYIVSPPDPRGSLGISLPFITMILKNLKRYFTFEIQILDDKQMRRRFRFSNYQSATKVRPFTCSVPLALKPGWNQMQLNLANFTMRAYGTNYLETQRVQVHANCRIRRVYFSDRLYAEEELPREYRVYLDVRSPMVPPSEKKVASIMKQPQTLEKQPTLVPTLLTQNYQEPLVTQTSSKNISKPTETQISQTSYKSISKQTETQVSHTSYKSISKLSTSNKSISEKRTSEILNPDKSLSNISLQGYPSSLKSIATAEFQPQTDMEKRESLISKISESSQRSFVISTKDVTVDEIAEGVDESETEGAGPDVEEHLGMGQSAEPTTKDEMSPRTNVLSESEYGESEPIFGSDAEESEELSS